ncbi:MAG: calcium-translocating P-type ATPase, PMCA-type [Clostridia bacterium]|nr:calcium-translocating P-type ATPase, PMCA-type [Clostridia bacterium]
MKAYDLTVLQIFNQLNTSQKGLDSEGVKNSKRLHGENKITKLKQKSLLRRIGEALLEPMLLILEVAMIITLGVNLGKFLKTGDGDFYECIGILLSIAISVFLTVYMEGKSRKAFELLDGLAGNVYVKVIRNGEKQVVLQSELAVGDVVFIEAGDKIFADGRLISSNGLSVDESTLTGESNSVSKTADLVLNKNTPLAERKNMVYSGTFAVTGNGSYVVTAVGDGAEMGVIANDLQTSDTVSAPLQEKLGKLSKTITWFGILSATFVLILTVARQFANNSVSFSSLQEAFLSAIVLIVASVPEGLPTTVAIALTLNVVKLSKSNALIKKLVATETVGCVSVICSDKTGTLTENKMTVIKTVAFSGNEGEILLNSALNSTAFLSGKKSLGSGSPTEIALLEYALKRKKDYKKLREEFKIEDRIPFSSDLKYMTTTVSNGSVKVKYLKGAPEKVIDFCAVDDNVKNAELEKIKSFQLDGKRVIAFAHGEEGSFHYDGFSVIADPVRKDVKRAVDECRRAGISVKMLTGDNVETAYSIARELGLAEDKSSVIVASDLDGLSDDKFKETLKTITVVARSTPKTKLKIVTALKETGEVVAVTGDGVNDAPAIRHADIGISMGNGSEITKEASDVILLDNSFSTIVKAISFGRNVYRNFQRFIMFQLSVNFSAVFFIVISLILGVESPFTTVQLLWINIIMDGPPALTLGLETREGEYMTNAPVKRNASLVSPKMFLRILIHASFICAVLVFQYKTDFLKVGEYSMNTVMFSLFILFQLFNAFNARELGSVSVFKNFRSNKPMLVVFAVTFVMQIALTQVFGNFFGTVALSFVTWLKMIATAFTIILLSEIYKFIKRMFN